MVARYGPAFRSSALFQRSVALVGLDAAQFVLLDPDRNFAARPAWDTILGGLFDNGAAARPGRPPRAPAGAAAGVQETGARFIPPDTQSLPRRGITAWPSGRHFDFYPAVKQLLLDNAIESFFGADPARDVAPLNRAFIDMLTRPWPWCDGPCRHSLAPRRHGRWH